MVLATVSIKVVLMMSQQRQNWHCPHRCGDNYRWQQHGRRNKASLANMKSRRVIMKRISFWMIFLSALLITSLGASIAYAQNSGPSDQEMQDMARGMGMDPRQCDDVQNRINQIVAIYESPLSDDEKMAKLTEAVAQSVAEMQQAAAKDPEVATAGNQYVLLIQGLLAAARTSASETTRRFRRGQRRPAKT
jgi:hypothetical protein